MNRFLNILGVAFMILVIVVACTLYPKLSNMSSEYGTAQAIRDVESYVVKNDGKWPRSAKDLEDKYPVGGEVIVDYSVTSEELVANPFKATTGDPPEVRKVLHLSPL